MDDESGESMEPMEEVPMKEPGESDSGAFRGIVYLMTQIAYSESQLVVTNVACKQVY